MFSVGVLFRDSQQILRGSWPYSHLCYHSDFYYTILIIVMEFLNYDCTRYVWWRGETGELEYNVSKYVYV